MKLCVFLLLAFTGCAHVVAYDRANNTVSVRVGLGQYSHAQTTAMEYCNGDVKLLRMTKQITGGWCANDDRYLMECRVVEKNIYTFKCVK